MSLILELLGFKPSLDGFVARLLHALPRQQAQEWTYDKSAVTLANTEGSQVSLTNMFLEYRTAKALARGDLIRKYVDTIGSIGREIPQLWVAAARNLIAVVRSCHVRTTTEIGSRDTPNTLGKV